MSVKFARCLFFITNLLVKDSARLVALGTHCFDFHSMEQDHLKFSIFYENKKLLFL
jgi:hypothetical protein